MELKVLSLKFFFNRIFSPLVLMSLFGAPSLAEGLVIKSYGHSALLIKGGGKSVLLNPFKPVGCAEGLKPPKLEVDIILASSHLPDEGARSSKGIFFADPGSYQVDGWNIEGISVAHDRLGGRRYGFATLWKWEQNGVKILHLGGGAAPLSLEDKLLLGRPDILIIAVGGGVKAYNGDEAAQITNSLNPKIVIPVQYQEGQPPRDCDQTSVEPFLKSMGSTPVKKVGKTFRVSKPIAKTTTIHLLN